MDPSKLDELNIHPSRRMRIDHGRANRPEPVHRIGGRRTVATPRSMDREEAVRLVRRLMTDDFADEDEMNDVIDRLERGLVCPHVSDYMFWNADPELTAEKIADRALSYEPFAL